MAAKGRCLIMLLPPGMVCRGAMFVFLAPSERGLSAKPTGGENCVLRLSLRHGLRPCHLPHRGRLDATALPWHTGRCGHRPLRTVSRSAVLWADRVVRPYGRATGCERETGGGISQGHSFRFAPQRRTLPLRTYSSAVLPLLCGGGFSCQESKMRATKTGADVV